MSDAELGFVAAICADPADDTARLVYADWLEENGQPERAEFIRWQVATDWKLTATGGPCVWSVAGPIGRRGLVPPACWRAANTFLSHPTPKPFTITRGFVSHLTCTAEDWLAHADALHWHPGQTVECPACDGTTSAFIYDANGKRIGGGMSTWKGRTRRGWPVADCPHCRNTDDIPTGRVPRPCPATAQPLERVTLTTFPELSLDWVTTSREGNVWRIARWPGIGFTLPASSAAIRFGDYPEDWMPLPRTEAE